MTGEPRPGKAPVNAALAGPYGHPFHPILVTVPIGAWVASLVFDIGSHLVRGPGFLARWLPSARARAAAEGPPERHQLASSPHPTTNPSMEEHHPWQHAGS